MPTHRSLTSTQPSASCKVGKHLPRAQASFPARPYMVRVVFPRPFVRPGCKILQPGRESTHHVPTMALLQSASMCTAPDPPYFPLSHCCITFLHSVRYDPKVLYKVQGVLRKTWKQCENAKETEYTIISIPTIVSVGWHKLYTVSMFLNGPPIAIKI